MNIMLSRQYSSVVSFSEGYSVTFLGGQVYSDETQLLRNRWKSQTKGSTHIVISDQTSSFGT